MQTDPALHAVLAYCNGLPRRDFAPGEALLEQGPDTGRLLILASGSVEILRDGTAVAEIHDPGAVFGELSALLGGDHSATVRATAPASAYVIEDARAFLQQRPDIVFHVACILARRLRDATSYLADFKQQYAGRTDHFGLVDEVLEALVQRQKPANAGGSRLKNDPRL